MSNYNELGSRKRVADCTHSSLQEKLNVLKELAEDYQERLHYSNDSFRTRRFTSYRSKWN